MAGGLQRVEVHGNVLVVSSFEDSAWLIIWMPGDLFICEV